MTGNKNGDSEMAAAPAPSVGRAVPIAQARLKRAYERLMWAYPRVWREHRQDEVLDILVDGAVAQGRSRPIAAEVVDLLGHGLAARAAELLGPVSPRLRRRVAMLSLGGGAATSAVCLALGELAIGGPGSSGSVPAVSPSPFQTFDVFGFVLWIAAFLLVLAGRAGAARWTCGAAGLVTAVLAIGGRSLHLLVAPLYLAVFLAGLAVFASQSRIQLRTGGTIGFAAGTALFTGVLFWSTTPMLPGLEFPTQTTGAPLMAFYRMSGTGVQAISQHTGLLLVVALTVGLVATPRRPGWFPAIGVASLPWLFFWTLFGFGFDSPHANRDMPVLALVTLTIIAVPAALAYRAGRASVAPHGNGRRPT